MGWHWPGDKASDSCSEDCGASADRLLGISLGLLQRLTRLSALPLIVLASLGARADHVPARVTGCPHSAVPIGTTPESCRPIESRGSEDPMAPVDLDEVTRSPWNSPAGLSTMSSDSHAVPLAIEGQVRQLEQRVRQLKPEAPEVPTQHQPITVLRGESIFGLEYLNSPSRIDEEPEDGANTYIGYRLRLNIDTSFHGEDRLRIRLQSRTIIELEDVTGSPLTNLSFDGNNFGRLEVSDLWYRFPIGKRTELSITAIGGSLRDNVPQVNPLFSGSSRGSISVFGSEDPIIRSRSGGALAVSHDISRQFNLSIAAVSSRPGNPAFGLFGKRHAEIVQLTYTPVKTFRSAIAVTRSLNDALLSDEFNDSDVVVGTSLSGEIFYQITDGLGLGLRGGLTGTSALDLPGKPRKTISSYGFTIGFPHFFGRDNLLGFVLGRPPAVSYDGVDNIPDDQSGHLEMFYRYTLSDQISITPGVMYIIAPKDSGGTERYWIGALRMTLRF